MTPGSIHATRLVCLRGCGGSASLDGDTYVCPDCGGNLDVDYDYDAIRASWKREDLRRDPDRSIWRYAPLYPVQGRIERLPIGWTPLIPAPR